LSSYLYPFYLLYIPTITHIFPKYLNIFNYYNNLKNEKNILLAAHFSSRQAHFYPGRKIRPFQFVGRAHIASWTDHQFRWKNKRPAAGVLLLFRA
jgi:hypothetical protein